MIATDTQHLRSQLLQSVMVLPKRGSLRRSARGEIEHVKRQNDVFLTFELTQADTLVIRRGEGELGGNLANFRCHDVSFLV